MRELLYEISQGFRKQNIETARLDAELLLSHTLKKKEFSFSENKKLQKHKNYIFKKKQQKP